MSDVTSVIDFLNSIRNITSNEITIAYEELDKIKSIKYVEHKNEYEYEQVIAENKKKKLEEIVYPKGNSINFKNSYKFFYRGHYKVDYNLIPSTFRDNNWEKEDYYYHEIMVRCPEKFQFLSHLDKLVLMQHFDCPTRLLDVTSNPLVALYFACKNFSCKKCSSSDQGKVFIFPVLADKVAYADSDKSLMLSCIPRFSTRDKQNLYQKCNTYLLSGKFSQITGGSRYKDDIVERYFHEITTELPSFKREIIPIDLLQPLFIQPNKSNGRILKQDGAFILSGLSNNYNEALRKIESISYREILIGNQENILMELEQIGIHEAALFPEVDKVANYLKER